VPQPADPSPDTLQYVTVSDNEEHGGFAGSKPVASRRRGNSGPLSGHGESALRGA
jgi:hypothetical protein